MKLISALGVEELSDCGLAEVKRQAGQTRNPRLERQTNRVARDPMRQPAQHQLKGNLTFDPRQRRAKAEVRRPPEARCRLSARVMSKRSGSGNLSGSRFPAALPHHRLAAANPPSAQNGVFRANRAVSGWAS